MCKKIEKHLKKHKTFYLALLVIALFATATLVLCQTEWFGHAMPGLKGSIIHLKALPKK
jgi:hypothetical protein